MTRLRLPGIVLLLTILLAARTCVASIQAGGAGYGLAFSGVDNSILSGAYKFPPNASGVTISYWLKLSPVLGSKILMSSVSLNAVRSERDLSSFVAISHASDENRTLVVSLDGSSVSVDGCSADPSLCRSDVPGILQSWVHYSISWNLTNGMFAAYVNGKPSLLRTYGQVQGTLIRLYSTTSEPRTLDCSRTTGGYVLEDSSCVFPFTYQGKTYDSCAPWSARPFIGSADPRKTRNAGFNFGLRWCATVKAYSRTTTTVQRRWGFCSCEDPELLTVDKDVMVYGKATRAWFSGTVPLTSFERSALITYDNCSMPLPTDLDLTGRIVVSRLTEKNVDCDFLSFSQRMSSFKAAAVLFIMENASSIAVAPTSSNETRRVAVQRVVSPVAWWSPLDAQSCAPLSALKDADLSTWMTPKGCSLQLSTLSGPPTVKQYALVVPIGVDLSLWQWRLSLRTEYQGFWQLIDRRAGDQVTQANETGTVRQYLMNISLPLVNTTDGMLVDYRLEWSLASGSNNASQSANFCSGFKLAEFRLFSFVDWASPAVISGTIGPSSLFAFPESSTIMPQSQVNALVLAINSGDSDFVTALGKTNIEFYSSVIPSSVENVALSKQCALVVGQKLTGSTTVDPTSGLTGVLEDIRLYSYAISRSQARSLFEDGGNFNNNDTNSPPSNAATVIPPSLASFPLDPPLSHFQFNVLEQSGLDAGQSRQALSSGIFPSILDSALLRSADYSSVVAARPPPYSIPSQLPRVLGTDIVVAVDSRGSPSVIELLVKNYRFGPGSLDVTIVTQPKFGTLSKLIKNNGSVTLSNPVLATVTYSASTTPGNAGWTSDSFVYEVSASLSALTARGTVRLVPSQVVVPQVLARVYRVKAGDDIVVMIGGAFSYQGRSLETVIDTSAIRAGTLTLANNCSFALPTVFRYPGVIALRYTAPPAADLSRDEIVERITWSYGVNGSTSAEINFTVYRQPLFANDEIQNAMVDYDPRTAVSDGQVLILRFSTAVASTPGSVKGLQFVQIPRFGRVFRYRGQLPAGAFNQSIVNASDIGPEIILANPSPQIKRVFASQVLRASSHFVAEVDLQECSVECSSSINDITVDSQSTISSVLGPSDSRGARFALKNAGHEFLELRLPIALVAKRVIVRQRNAGSGALFRVSVGRSSAILIDRNACGGTGHSRTTMNFSTPIVPGCNRSKDPMPTSDCSTDWASWDIAFHDRCASDSIHTGPGDFSWTESSFPVCSLDVAIDTIRLDFDTRLAFDWTEIDSVSVEGFFAPASGASSIAVVRDDVSAMQSFVYIPTPGVTGQERLSLRSVTMSCSVSDPPVTFRWSISSLALYAPPSMIAVSPSGGIFNFDFSLDVSSALNFLAKAVHSVGSNTDALRLWPSTANLWAYLAFPASSFNPGARYTFEQTVGPVGLATTLIPFRQSNLNASVLVGGDVPVVARLDVFNFSDLDPSARVSFAFAFSLSGACGQASQALGACSTAGRPYVGGQCVRTTDQRYQCQCKQATDPVNDVVVAGAYCQYDSLSTCFGRGYPDSNGICTCFQPDLFGANNCNKRKFNTTVEGLKTELDATLRKYSFALSIMGVTEMSVVDLSASNKSLLLLTGQIGTRTFSFITLNVSEELATDNSCNGNGIPLKGSPLVDTDCACDDGWFPRKNCKAKVICSSGEYRAGAGEGATCLPCPVGFRCDGLDIKPCGTDTFNLEPRSSRCFATCSEAGIFNAFQVRRNDTDVSCVQCEPGNFCDGIVSRQCPVGTFWTKARVCIECNDLGLNYYSSVPGSLSCQPCPSGTSRLDGTPGVSVLECVCQKGKWNNNPRNTTASGVPCVDCPDNAMCDGYDAVPIPLVKARTLAGSDSASPMRLLQDGADNSSADGADDDANATNYMNSRPYPSEGYWGDPDYPSEFFPCEDSCLGGKNFSCKEGYQGKLCNRCAAGYHNINGLCYKCPGGSDNNALVFFGIAGIVIAFVILNRASAEVQALDIALLYAQVANLVQQFSFYFPPPVSELENYYGVTDFNIDFITADCARQDRPWTFTDSFFAQWFLIWYIGLIILVVNGCAKLYSMFRESRKKKLELVAKEVDLHAQRRRAAKAAARQAVVKLELRRQKTGEVAYDSHEAQSGQGPSVVVNETGPGGSSEDSAGATASPRVLFSEEFNILSESSRYDLSSRESKSRCGRAANSIWARLSKRCPCLKRSSAKSAQVGSQMQLRFDDEDKVDPRFRAIARWIRRTLGFPKNQVDYVTYTNGQLAGWLNLTRIVYNSVIIVCLRSFFCVGLADGTQVLRAWPDMQCGSTEHSILVAFGALGMVVYAIGVPAFVYAVLTYGANHNKKADTNFFERFGFMYVNYRQTLYRWEILVLLRRLAMCVILVCAEGYPYIQAIFGGTVIVACLAAQLYHRPYLSDRINFLESIALSSIFFYLLCGLVFTGLNDLYESRQSSASVQNFISQFSTILSWILLVVSLLTILICFLVFLQDLRDFFNVLVTERSLFRKAKSEDVALIRVIRADTLKAPKADRDLAKEIMELASGKKAPVKPPAGREAMQRRKDRKFNQRRRRSSMSLSLGALSSRNSKQPHTLFTYIDKDGNNTISREELLQYATGELGLEDSEETRARIERIFRMYDVDVSGSVDVKEFMDMVRSELPSADECELKDTFKPKYLIKWAASNKVTPVSVALFFELDKQIRGAVSDDSFISAYRDTSQAKFYRAIAEAFPFLADWLASASQEDVRAFGKILEELNECRDMVGSRGTFSKITVEIDRAPVVWWLVHATEEERKTFREVFGSICEASSVNGTEFPIWRRIKSGSSVRDAQKEVSEKRTRRLSLSEDPTASPFLSTRAFRGQTPSPSNGIYSGGSAASSPSARTPISPDSTRGSAQEKDVAPGNLGRMMDEEDPATDNEADSSAQESSWSKNAPRTTPRRQWTAEELLGNTPTFDVESAGQDVDAIEDVKPSPPETKADSQVDKLNLV